MASPGNPNQAAGPFDMNKFFKPTNPTSPNPTNLTSSPYPPPPPSSSYPPPTGGAYSYPAQPYQYHHHHLPPYTAAADHQQLPNLHNPQRSVSFPTPPLQAHPHIQPQNPNPNPNPNPGARLMALLSAPPPSTHDNPQQQQQPGMPPLHPVQPSSSGSEYPTPASSLPILPSMIPPSQIINPGGIAPPTPLRMPSSKLPKGRHLTSDHAVYDIDARLQGEVQPQLEVTPITKYVSDPQLVVGRQIAVNKTYICYGLKLGNIRILNINTALRSLLRGHTQRVTDMAFFAEDVHLLASVSIDGRIYVWKISEGPDEEDKPQITGKVVIALQIIGDGESVHPRICWHCHKQEVLVVGIGRRVLRIDTTKVGRNEVFSAEEPLKCPVDRLIDGVQLVGKHDGEVTDLSMCQWMTTRLVSASVDGTIKIWEDRKAQPLLVIRPHDGQPVYSATFVTAPHRPEHVVLITAGPSNRELKIWVSAGEEGWLLPSDAEQWHCTQTLDLKSSAEPRVEEAFFNQVVALPQAGLFLLANAKKNAIYAVHLEYGANPAATRMDYIAEFTVTMPILSFTGTSDLLPHGERIVQVYCVQTQAIQQYALDLTQCLPPPLENMGLEKSESNISRVASTADIITSLEPPSAINVSSAASRPSAPISSGDSVSATSYPTRSPVEAPAFQECGTPSTESKPVALAPPISDTDIMCVGSPPPLSPRLSRKLSGLRSPTSNYEPGPLSDNGGNQPVIDYSVDREMDSGSTKLADKSSVDDESRSGEGKAGRDDISTVHSPVMFKHPTHLVTPAEILRAVSSSESTSAIESKTEGETNNPDVATGSDVSNVELEVKVVGEAGPTQKEVVSSQGEPQIVVSENKEKAFCSQASDLGLDMARECSALTEPCVVEEAREGDGGNEAEVLAQSSKARDSRDVSGKATDATCQQTPPPSSKGKKKGKNSQIPAPSSPSPSTFDSTDLSNEVGSSSSMPTSEAAVPSIIAMQETLNQLMTMQKELQKQMTVMVAVPVTKEGRRLEAAVGRTVEKCVKANSDALWARVQEENAKQERLLRDRLQQINNLITNLITNYMNKDLPAMLEKTLKKEITAIGPAVARTVTTSMEKMVSSAIAETLQRGLGDKAVNQLDKSVNSKLEATVARQIQVQFQTSGKQALHDALRSSLEASLIPAFEMSCKTMFEQVDATFQKGMSEHAIASHQQFESSHSPLALTLRDAINSASSMTQTLSGELADGQRKLLAFAAAGANSKAINPLITQLSNGTLTNLQEKVREPEDPTKELSRLIAERKFEEAFTGALQRSDVLIVSWLCSQVDLQGILSMIPMPLSQGVLLSLLQQLACDISKDTPRKLAWMTEVAAAINPADPMIAMHVRPIFEQVYQILNHHRGLPTTSSSEMSSIRLVMHVINSVLTTCK